MTLSHLLITRRDNAAHTWLHATRTTPRRLARARLALWDTLLDAWTNHGRRH